MAELFQRDRSVIGKHVRNIFKEGELQKESVWAKFAYTAADGKVYDVDYYNLDVIISVGYRVKSKRGTQFRIWATGILKEYMRKGFALDDERLKNLGGGGYFKELLERIRDIRAFEKVFYCQVLEIYATSIDYDPKAEISVQFFKKVQNKIHYLSLKMTQIYVWTMEVTLKRYHGHSLSVSDVIMLNQDGKISAHYVDSIGFKELPGFLDKKPERTSVLQTLKEKCDAPECNPAACRKARDEHEL